jgi:multiple sugar transport system substrate-binding protein
MRRNIPLFMLLISSCGSQNVVRTNLWKEENDMEGSTTSLLSRRRFLARLALMLGTALGAGSLLPACGDQSKPSLTIMVDMPQRYLAEFQQRSPSLRILYQPENRIKLFTDLLASTDLDVFECDDEDIPRYASRGVLTDLTTYCATSRVVNSSNLLSVNDAYRWNGRLLGKGPRYALTSSWSYPLLWFNKTLFDQQGIAYPSETVPMSYDDLLALGKRLTVHEGNEILVYGLDPGWNTGMLYGLLVQNLAQAGTSLFSSDQMRTDFTTPQAKELLQWYVTWAQAGIGPSPVTPANVTNVQILYRQGKLAMMIADTSVVAISSPLIPSPLSSQTGLAPLPQW